MDIYRTLSIAFGYCLEATHGVLSQSCTFPAAWLGKWFTNYDTSGGLPWTYVYLADGSISWDLQGGANLKLPMACHDYGIQSVDQRMYYVSSLYGAQLCMQTTTSSYALLIRDHPATSSQCIDFWHCGSSFPMQTSLLHAVGSGSSFPV